LNNVDVSEDPKMTGSVTRSRSRRTVRHHVARFVAAAAAVACLVATATVSRATERTFRTDGGDEKLPWFQLKDGEFPPEGSAHAISGELIALDHINRTGVLRPDRTDAQRRGDWDLPLPFVMLPYGCVRYHGAPAELRDVPIGTHLHGQFYADAPAAKVTADKKRAAVEAAFRRVIRLEDDFSLLARQNRRWRVDAVQPDAGKIAVTPVGREPASSSVKPTTYQVGPTTRVWKGRAVGALADVAVGQSVLMNLTYCTLKGPGRVTNLWLDAESQAVATAHQTEVHRQYQREHGLAGYVDAVDNRAEVVSVVLFAGFDPALKDDLPVGDVVAAVVAEDSLRSWDQINDRKAGPVVAVGSGPPGPGNSGVRIKFKPGLLLEGYRPGRVVRLFSSKWKLDDLPREERLYP
jgi:hypothetical protein